MYKFFRKTHKWVGLFIALLIILFALSGVVLNHRKALSGTDISRNFLPDEYRYQNWNNAAVRATLKLDTNRFLMYGNIGIWQTDSAFSKYTSFNAGFPSGVDNRKIFKVLQTDCALLAGTLFGLYNYDPNKRQWIKIPLPVHEENVVDLLRKGDSTFVMTRSHLLITTDLKQFHTIELPLPVNYDHKTGLFKTLWLIHSGEIYGSVGKLIVDAIALIFIFLSVGGIILFIAKKQLKTSPASSENKQKIKQTIRWNLRWHNRIGWITALLLFLTTLTGMFLRPPLLIAIANDRVGKLPYTELDTPNPWFDVLRRIIYLPEQNIFVVSTADGFYSFNKEFKTEARFFEYQPPASVMGVTVLEQLNEENILVGSFEGLYMWNFNTGETYDLIKREPYLPSKGLRSPVGDYKVSGFTTDFGREAVFFDYDKGAITLTDGKSFGTMPDYIADQSPMSLWNIALEMHTGRIFSSILGLFYILIVPLGGLLILLTLVGGVVIWLKYFR